LNRGENRLLFALNEIDRPAGPPAIHSAIPRDDVRLAVDGAIGHDENFRERGCATVRGAGSLNIRVVSFRLFAQIKNRSRGNKM